MSEENTSEGLERREVVEYKRDPEIIANEPLADMQLIVSIPTYHKEWKRGVLVRNVEAMLSQNMSNSSMEVNYIMNTGQLHPWTEEYDRQTNEWVKRPNPDITAQAAFKESQEGLNFLRTVVELQKMAREGADQSMVQSIFEQYDDPHIKHVLELAVKKATSVSISAVDVTRCDLYNELQLCDDIDGFRTIGLDYAVNRFKNKDNGVFLMSDADTVPAFNSMGKDLVNVFHENPDAKYYFLRMGYVPPGEDKINVKTSTQFIGAKVGEYNLKQIAGAPQIALRSDALSQISEISRMFGSGTEGDEDRDTALRSIGLFGDISKGLLIDTVNMPLPVQLTQDRTMGVNDGAHRKGMGEKIQNVSFEEQLSVLENRRTTLLNEVKQEIDNAPSDIKAKLEKELLSVQHQLETKQKALIRFNRQVMTDFLKIREQIPSDPSVELPVDLKNEILNQKRGVALLGYVEQNRNLISELNDEDVTVIEYLLGGRETNPVPELNTFQKTVREYIGEYPHGEASDRTMEMQPLLVDIMAYGEIHHLWGQRKLIHEGSIDGQTPSKPDEWFDKILNFEGRFPNRDKSWLKQSSHS